MDYPCFDIYGVAAIAGKLTWEHVSRLALLVSLCFLCTGTFPQLEGQLTQRRKTSKKVLYANLKPCFLEIIN